MKPAVVVWRFCDGKPGHERQTKGLLDALAELIPTAAHTIPTAGITLAAWDWLRGRYVDHRALSAPDLLIGAGSACQWPLAAARRARGGYSVYLMKPSLPPRFFDLCLVPRHDGVAPAANILVTDGVLNDIKRDDRARADRMLVLVGGPSRHHDWDQHGLLTQLATLIERAGTDDVVITDSRRTPAGTRVALAALVKDRVRFVPAAETSAQWLADELSSAASVWVTRDSVSMIFEALTAGAAVGLIDVPSAGHDRITRVSTDLIESGKVISFQHWLSGGARPLPEPPLREARRCAEVIVTRWFQSFRRG